MNYTDINAKKIDEMVLNGWKWGQPISHREYIEAKNGNWKVFLSPTKPVPKEWFSDLKDKKILGLASGGAQQMPIFAALEADCTILDYSLKQLESEREFAQKEGYNINIVHADMTKELPFEDESFDIIFHPVSNCYVEDVNHIWKECYRVLKPQGILMSGQDNGLNFLFDGDQSHIVDYLPFNPLVNKVQMDSLLRDGSTIQFSHSVEDHIKGQIKAGFKLLDMYEDTNDVGYLKEHGVSTFCVTLSQKESM